MAKFPSCLPHSNGARSNNSFKPNLLRSTNNMAGKACHVVGSATQVGLTQALGRMYCPYCSSTLSDASDGQMRCSSTGSLFSARVSATLRARYGHADVVTKQPEPVQTGEWFCPGCGVKMDSAGCSSCGQSFELALLRQIIELNPHVS